MHAYTLTINGPCKNASENSTCLSGLLYIFANINDKQ